jgi:hypothetical protein
LKTPFIVVRARNWVHATNIAGSVPNEKSAKISVEAAAVRRNLLGYPTMAW